MTTMCRSRFPSEIRSSFLKGYDDQSPRERFVTLHAGNTAKKQGGRTITLCFSESRRSITELSMKHGRAKASSIKGK